MNGEVKFLRKLKKKYIFFGGGGGAGVGVRWGIRVDVNGEGKFCEN